MSTGQFKLSERSESCDKQIGDVLPLDDFVRYVDSLAPPPEPRVTKSEAAFAKQLVKKGRTQ